MKWSNVRDWVYAFATVAFLVFLVGIGFNPIFIGIPLILIIWFSILCLRWRSTHRNQKKMTEYFIDKFRYLNAHSKLIASIYTGIAAVIALVFRSQIEKQTKNWITPIIDYANGSGLNQLLQQQFVAIYWLFFIGWVITYIIFVYGENANNKENTLANKALLTDIKSAVINAPNQNIFAKSSEIFRDSLSYLAWLNETLQDGVHDSKEKKLTAYETTIRNILGRICELTEVFCSKETAVYDANIMIFFDTKSYKDSIKSYRDDPVTAHQWIYLKGIDINLIAGVVRVAENLVKMNSGRTPSVITLPVISLTEYIQPELPGAPRAMIKGEDIIDDVSRVVDTSFNGQSAETISQAREYFKDKLNGVSSFISIAIPETDISDETIEVDGKSRFIGVLNIDCSKPYPFGEVGGKVNNVDYSVTYFALLKPILGIISPYVKEYVKIKYNNPD